MRTAMILFLSAAALQACTLTAPQPTPIPPPDLSSCGAIGLDGLIGSSITLLPKSGAWAALRVIEPGQMVTMDFSPTRLNVMVDDAGTILSLTCG